jgi:hypothetical protein
MFAPMKNVNPKSAKRVTMQSTLMAVVTSQRKE